MDGDKERNGGRARARVRRITSERQAAVSKEYSAEFYGSLRPLRVRRQATYHRLQQMAERQVNAHHMPARKSLGSRYEQLLSLCKTSDHHDDPKRLRCRGNHQQD